MQKIGSGFNMLFYKEKKHYNKNYNISLSDDNKLRSLIKEPMNIVSNNIDGLVLSGIKYIQENGERFNARAGSGQQAYDVSYTLLDPTDRLHNIRKDKATKYFCRELLAYFKGSLNVNEGLAQAASMWKSLADKDGKIASNYGYYVFYQRIPESDNITQYEWVIRSLEKNLDSRKAFININQPSHKVSDSKDFPCTLGMQFFVRNNYLCCAVSSRSTDIYTGLPYDMGFFSFVTELVYKDLKERLPEEKSRHLKLGYVIMKTSFTQIYDKTRDQALSLIANCENSANHDKMPSLENAQESLKDIYQQTFYTPVMQWIYENAKLPVTK